MPHLHEIIDSDNHFTIDPVTRLVANDSDKVKLVQYDHNSERFTFQCPRMIEGHDMSLCTAIRVQYININKKTKESNAGVYEVDDIIVSSDNPDTIVFSWLISRNATQFVGTLSFLIEFICIADDGTIDYAWHTDIYKYITVTTGMDNAEAIEEKYPDILEKWKSEILADLPTVYPHPITRIESLDKTNIIALRNLDSGTYVLCGYFKPFDGSTSTMTFGSNILVSIVKKTSESHVQIFYPNNNCVQYVKITDDSYERKNIYLNDLNDTVRFDEAQELTEDQQTQALENIRAVDKYNGLKRYDVTYPASWGSGMIDRTVYTNGALIQPNDVSTSTELGLAWTRFMQFIGLTVSTKPATEEYLVKSAAILADNGCFGDNFWDNPKSDVRTFTSVPTDPYAVKIEVNVYDVATKSIYVSHKYQGARFQTSYSLINDELGTYAGYAGDPIRPYSNKINEEPAVTQFQMKTAPTSDMQVATKQYVDNTVEDAKVQPDWNQNDETAADYIKNRPGGYTESSLESVTITGGDTLDGKIDTVDTVDYGLVFGRFSYSELPTREDLKTATKIYTHDYKRLDNGVTIYPSVETDAKFYVQDYDDDIYYLSTKSSDSSLKDACLVVVPRSSTLNNTPIGKGVYLLHKYDNSTKMGNVYDSVTIDYKNNTHVKIPSEFVESDFFMVRVESGENEFELYSYTSCSDIYEARENGKYPLIVLYGIMFLPSSIDVSESVFTYASEEDGVKFIITIDDYGAKFSFEKYSPTSIPKIESLDESNIQTFRSLEDGTYILEGYFTPYTGSDSTLIFDPPALVSINSTESETHVQIFEAYDNQIQHLIITDTSCETTYVLLNDLVSSASKIGDLSTLKTTAKDTLVDAINEATFAIPAVTESDNGKILRVVDGAWAAAAIPNAEEVSF